MTTFTKLFHCLTVLFFLLCDCRSSLHQDRILLSIII
uniref:Uncharacterized protein n=1 Tax=Anguilla anguilla TaxID=7936 RepID=A0A0E9VE73_ANGAN